MSGNLHLVTHTRGAPTLATPSLATAAVSVVEGSVKLLAALTIGSVVMLSALTLFLSLSCLNGLPSPRDRRGGSGKRVG